MKHDLVKEAVEWGAYGAGVAMGTGLVFGVGWLGYAAVKGVVGMVKKHKKKKLLENKNNENESQEEGA